VNEEALAHWGLLRRKETKKPKAYFSPNIFRVIKSSRMKWAVHVALIKEKGVVYGFWWGNLRERDHSEDPDVDGRLVFRRILRKWDRDIDWIDLAEDGNR